MCIFPMEDLHQRASRAGVCHKRQLCNPGGQRIPALWCLMCSSLVVVRNPLTAENHKNT